MCAHPAECICDHEAAADSWSLCCPRDLCRSDLVSHPGFVAGFSNDKSLGGETASVLIITAIINRLVSDFLTLFFFPATALFCPYSWLVEVTKRAFYASSDHAANPPIVRLLHTILQTADNIFTWLRGSKLNKWQQEILAGDNIELSSKFKTQSISAAISSIRRFKLGFILTPLKLFPALSWWPFFGLFWRNHSASPDLKSATQTEFAYSLTS